MKTDWKWTPHHSTMWQLEYYEENIIEDNILLNCKLTL
jgi:hypothetical protein